MSYYYALSAGPGQVTIVGVGKNCHAGSAIPLRVQLVSSKADKLCEISLGNSTSARKIESCDLSVRQELILRIDLDPATIDWGVRLDGAVHFQPDIATAAPDSDCAISRGQLGPVRME